MQESPAVSYFMYLLICIYFYVYYIYLIPVKYADRYVCKYVCMFDVTVAVF